MRAATLYELKAELETLTPKQLQHLCLRLAKFKKENKELLTYLLLEAHDEDAYVQAVKDEITDEFSSLGGIGIYHTKKALRRILKMVNKQIRYSGLPTTEIALRIHFCRSLKESQIPFNQHTVLMNLYAQQLSKIHRALSKIDEDLQFDYHADIELLNS